ncbi:MAG: hypothetical protein AAB425_01575 [Bdellovibrionota bacterium]
MFHSQPNVSPRLLLMLGLFAITVHPGCSILVGNVRPIETKSNGYRYDDLSQASGWVKKSTKADDTHRSNELSDIVFQSQTTAAIISLNSACRESRERNERDLRTFTQSLLMGISEIERREERDVVVSGVPALETTVQGKVTGQIVMLRTIVARKDACLFDVMYVTRPASFESELGDFAKFVASLRL